MSRPRKSDTERKLWETIERLHAENEQLRHENQWYKDVGILDGGSDQDDLEEMELPELLTLPPRTKRFYDVED